MSVVSLDSRCTERLVPSPTKLPTIYPSESILTSLATLMESSGAGGLSFNSSPRNRPALWHPTPAIAPVIMAAVTSLRSLCGSMAVNVPSPGEKGKGFGDGRGAISY